MSDDELEESRGHDEVPRGKLLPLNSRRLTAAYLKHIALSLELPTAGSVDETRVLVEGKLRETHDVANVQVVIDEATTSTTTVNLSLMDDDSVFLKTPPLTKSAKEPRRPATEADRCRAEERVVGSGTGSYPREPRQGASQDCSTQ